MDAIKNLSASPIEEGAMQRQIKLVLDRLRHLYPLVYGTELNLEECKRLVHFFAGDISNYTEIQLIRTVIAGTDRQLLETPFFVRFGPSDLHYMEVEGFQIALDSADCAVSGTFLRGQCYEPHLTAFFKQTLKPGMSMVDIGANIGYYSLLASHIVGNEGRVTSFEPNSENCRLLLLSIEKNRLSNIDLIPVGLSLRNGYQIFSTFMGSNGGFVASNADTLSSPQTIVVPTFRLDDLISRRVDFIKIDVEGAEQMVMNGACKIIERDRPIITSEFSPWMLGRVSKVSGLEYLKFFRDRGYRIVLLGRTAVDRAIESINDIERFMLNFGHFSRIEDIAFIPE